MMPFSFGDVVLVRFPFTNQLTSKQRPAVVISKHYYNDIMPDVVLMPITSQLRATAVGEALLTEWQAAGLLKPSAVKPLFATFEQTLLLSKLGTLSTADQTMLRTAIAQVIG